MLSPWNNRLDATVYCNENDRNSRYHRLYRQVPNQKFDQSLFFSLQSAKFNPQVYFELLATTIIFEVSTVLSLLFIVTLPAFWTHHWSVPYPTVMVMVGSLRIGSDHLAWLLRLGLAEEHGWIENQSGIGQRTYFRTLHW
jgi:hypothetical protein